MPRLTTRATLYVDRVPSGCFFRESSLANNFQDSLTYGCLCSDGKQPNMTEYTLTLPFHMCTEWGTQCVAGCGSDSECAYNCRANHPCGAQSPNRANSTTSSATSSATQTATTSSLVYSGFNGESQDSNGNAAGALRFGDSYSLAIVAGGLFAGFAMLL